MSHTMWFPEGVEYFEKGPQTPIELEQDELFAKVVLKDMVEDYAIYYWASRERSARLLVRSINGDMPRIQAIVRHSTGAEQVYRGDLLGSRSKSGGKLFPGVLTESRIPVIQELSGGLLELPRIIRGPQLRNSRIKRFKAS